jgi:hypothetical protein
MYTITQNELKAVLKASAQTGESGAVNKTSVESTAQDDDFQKVKTRESHVSKSPSTLLVLVLQPIHTTSKYTDPHAPKPGEQLK